MNTMVQFEQGDEKDLGLLGFAPAPQEQEGVESVVALIGIQDVYWAAQARLANLQPRLLTPEDRILASQIGTECVKEMAAVKDKLEATNGNVRDSRAANKQVAELQERYRVLRQRLQVYAIASRPDATRRSATPPQEYARLAEITDAMDALGGGSSSLEALNQEAARLGQQMATVYPFTKQSQRLPA